MAWNDIPNNKMITFADVENSGATLKNGQTASSSNKCITKLEATTKYNLVESSLSSFSNQQLIPKVSWIFEIFNARWDTLNTTLPLNNAFDVRRSTDNVIQTFNYTELIDETYDTFLGGATGYITNWYGDNYNLTNTNTTYQPKLIPNSGAPFMYSYGTAPLGGNALLTEHSIKFLNDWIVTIVLNGEENSNNERANLTIATSTKVVLAFQVATSAASTHATLLYEKPVASITGAPDLRFNITNPAFKLVTFRYVSGVLTVYVNNVLVTLTSATSDAYTIGMNATLINRINLGATRQINGNIGKVNKYKHLSIVSGNDLSTFNISTYNQEIITRYSIV